MATSSALAQTVEPPLAVAQRCYGAGDFGCVVRTLSPNEAVADSAPLADRAERWRMLAFAAARLDRHDLAQHAFVHWLQLDPSHHLDRASTPPVVWQDYAAAWLQVRGGDLDLRPVVPDHPQLQAPVLTPRDWPKFAPPPRSNRDQARDFVFELGPVLTVPAATPVQAVRRMPDHLGVAVGLAVQPWQDWRLGAHLQATRWYADSHSRIRGEVTARVGWTLWQRQASRLELIGGAGAAFEPTAAAGSAAVLALGMRYHRQPPQQALGWAVQLADHVALGGDSGHLIALAVALVLQPASK